MKTLTIILCAIGLSACGSYKLPPVSDLIVDKEVHPMTRNEVINAIGECESSGNRASVITSKRRINGYVSEIQVDVHCYPYHRVK